MKILPKDSTGSGFNDKSRKKIYNRSVDFPFDELKSSNNESRRKKKQPFFCVLDLGVKFSGYSLGQLLEEILLSLFFFSRGNVLKQASEEPSAFLLRIEDPRVSLRLLERSH